MAGTSPAIPIHSLKHAPDVIRPTIRLDRQGMRIALLGREAVEQPIAAVKLVDVLRYHRALRVLPRAVADAVAGVGGLTARRRVAAEVGMPGLAARPGRRGQRLAMGVRAGEPAEIAALAGAGAGDEE